MRVRSYTRGWIRLSIDADWQPRAESCGAGALYAIQPNIERRFQIERHSDCSEAQFAQFIDAVLNIADWKGAKYDPNVQTITWKPHLNWYQVYALLTLIRYPSENPGAVRDYFLMRDRGLSKDVAMFACGGTDTSPDAHAFAMPMAQYWKLPADLSIARIVEKFYNAPDFAGGFWSSLNRAIGVETIPSCWAALSGPLTPEKWEFICLDKPYNEKKAIHAEMLAKTNVKTYAAVGSI